MAIIFSDIDGTIYPFLGKVTTSTVKKIQSLKQKNVPFIMNTGNGTFPKLIDLAKEFNSRYIILSSGAEIYDLEKDEYIRIVEFDKQIAQQIFDITVKHNCGLYFFTPEQLYYYNVTDEFQKFISQHTGRANFIISAQVPKRLTKIEICDAPEEDLYACYQELLQIEGLDSHINYMGGKHMEITPGGINKGEAVEWMCKNVFHEKLDDVMTIGDSENDIDMLKIAGHSYAMDNAPRTVKNVAKHYTCDVTQEGLSMAIDDYLHRMKLDRD